MNGNESTWGPAGHTGRDRSFTVASSALCAHTARTKVPSLRLDRLVPQVVRSSTARESLRDMTPRQRRLHSGMFSLRGTTCTADRKQSERTLSAGFPHEPQSERIHTADTRVNIEGDLDTGHAEMWDSYAWGRDNKLQARQDGLMGTNEKYSAVRARVSNVCRMHLMQLERDLQQETDACQQAIYWSVSNEDDPEAMVATKAKILGAGTVTKQAHLPPVKARRSVRVQGMRPPSSSQLGGLQQVLFGERRSILHDPLSPMPDDSAEYLSCTFMTEIASDKPQSRADLEDTQICEEGKRKKFSKKALNRKVTERLVKSRETVKPIVRNVAVINHAIKNWLKGGGRHARVDHHGEGIVKNAFDAAGQLASSKQIEKLQQMLEQQKEVICDPELAQHLIRDDAESKKNFLGYNKDFVDASVPEVRNAHVLHQLVKRSHRKDQAIHNRHKVAQHKLAHTQLEVERKLPGCKKLKENLSHHQRMQEIEFLQVMTGIQAIKALLRIHGIFRLDRISRFRRKIAAKRIQRMIRAHKVLGQIRGTIQWARKTVRRFLRALIRRTRGNQKHPSADLIKKFLSNMKEAARVLPTIALFRQRVIRIQNAARRLIERVRETYDYNLEVFDRVEAKSIKFLLNLKDKQKRSRSINKATFVRVPSQSKEALEKLKEAIQEMGLPSDIKNNAVRSLMKLRRKRYLEEMVVYEINTRLYHKQFEKREIMVARIMEFTGNSNEDEIKELTARLSGGTITFVEKPKPVIHERYSNDEEMRDIWWKAALRATMGGKAEALKQMLLGLEAAGLLDETNRQRIKPLLHRPGSPLAAAAARSPARSGAGSPDRLAQPSAPAASLKDVVQVSK